MDDYEDRLINAAEKTLNSYDGELHDVLMVIKENRELRLKNNSLTRQVKDLKDRLQVVKSAVLREDKF
jgi:cell division protein FtsB